MFLSFKTPKKKTRRATSEPTSLSVRLEQAELTARPVLRSDRSRSLSAPRRLLPPRSPRHWSRIPHTHCGPATLLAQWCVNLSSRLWSCSLLAVQTVQGRKITGTRNEDKPSKRAGEIQQQRRRGKISE
ncbi:hypothetical protein AOLI_G00029910 [Acnodon oligacanthus]